MNFLGPKAIGINSGYGICLRKDHVTNRLLSHEDRHVQQYEAAGSVRVFIAKHIQQMFQYGCYDAPYGLNARAHGINR